MQYRVLFRLMIKAVGVLLIGQGVCTLAGSLLSVAAMLGQAASFAYVGGWMIAPLMQIAFGVYCFRGGSLFVNLAVPDHRLYCPTCGRELTDSKERLCPDCETPTQRAVPLGY